MKNFKDKTKFGQFLSKITAVGIDVAPIIAKASKGNIIGAINDTVQLLKGEDTRESKELLDDLLIKKKTIELDFYRISQASVNNRWSLDMTSDSWLSKNIRPLTLAWLIVSVTLICILDSSNTLTVKEYWVTMFSSLLMTVIVAYFGGRSYEKGRKIK